MDSRNFSPGKYYCDEGLYQGQRRLQTSTPRGRRQNPYQRSPEFGPRATCSTPSAGHWKTNWRDFSDSWRSRDSSRNSSFNSSFTSPGGRSLSPGGFKQHYNKGFRRDQDFNTSARNIAAYFHVSMLENPWQDLERKSSSSPGSVTKQQNISGSSDISFIESSEGDKVQDISDPETDSPNILVESVTEYLYD